MTHHRNIKLVEIPPWLGFGLDDVDFLECKRPLVPDIREHCFCLRAKPAILAGEQRYPAGLQKPSRGPHRSDVCMVGENNCKLEAVGPRCDGPRNGWIKIATLRLALWKLFPERLVWLVDKLPHPHHLSLMCRGMDLWETKASIFFEGASTRQTPRVFVCDQPAATYSKFPAPNFLLSRRSRALDLAACGDPFTE